MVDWSWPLNGKHGFLHLIYHEMTNTYMWVVKMSSKMHLFYIQCPEFSILILNLSNLECVQLCSIISSQNICNILSTCICTILWIYSRFIPAEVLIMKFYTAKFKTTSKVNKIVTCTKSIQTNVRVSKILRETPQVYTLYGQ